MGLCEDDKRRYIEKLTFKGKCFPDPYEVSEASWKDDVDLWPQLEWPNIYHYFVHTASLYTNEEIGAYRSLEAYNYVKSGHVKKLEVYAPSGNIIFVRGAVMPSQRLSKNKPYLAWAMIEKTTGVINCGHCTCMAGVGEACSHVAATLLLIEMMCRNRRGTDGDDACTSILCQWKKTTHKVVFAKNKDIEYVNFKTKKRKPATDTEEVQVDSEKIRQCMFSVADVAPDSVLAVTLKKQKNCGKVTSGPLPPECYFAT